MTRPPPMALLSLPSIVIVIVTVLAVAGCTRTPPEPTGPVTDLAANAKVRSDAASPTATTVTAPTTTAAAAADARETRCIREMPNEPAPKATPASAAACPKDPAPQTFPTATLSFPEATGTLRSITVELARTPDETARGLMYRRSMPEDHGMLFDLRVRRPQAFWMRNTCIPLDMMFVEDDGLVVGILEQVPVLNEEQRTVGCPSRYVLEVNAGFARKHGIKPGQKIKLP